MMADSISRSPLLHSVQWFKKKKKEEGFMWINALSMGHLLFLLFRHLGITDKLGFTVAAEGFWGSKEGREERLSLTACFGCCSTGAEFQLWPASTRNYPSSSQTPGKPCPLWRATMSDFVFLALSVRMWIWKFQARLKSWWCARDKTREKSPQTKSFPDMYFDIRILSILY